MQEQILEFDCHGEPLLGILAEGGVSADIGVIIVVGGPQYRIGSHRQFVLLARALATAGYPCLRFDHRGIGDSVGNPQSFEALNDDIAAAIDALQAVRPGLSRIVLWGLCDAASAILIYWEATRDVRVAGLALANPWVRSEKTQAEVLVRHYYMARIADVKFWKKLLAGQVDVWAGLREFFLNFIHTRRGGAQSESFQELMLSSLLSFQGPLLLLMSGRDYTAREFDIWFRQPRQSAEGRGLELQRVDLPDADHTFSHTDWQNELDAKTCSWLHTFVASKFSD